jgi:hypothetical protein
MVKAQFLAHAVSAFLILPVPLGVRPGTFGPACSLRYPMCGQCRPDANSAGGARQEPLCQ